MHMEATEIFANIGCVIPAAGNSSLTPGRSKLMAPIGDKPLIVHTVDNVLRAGCSDIIVVVNKFTGEAIRDAIRENFSQQIIFVVQPDFYGMGDAVNRGARTLHGSNSKLKSFLVVPGDSPLWVPEVLSAVAREHIAPGASSRLKARDRYQITVAVYKLDEEYKDHIGGVNWFCVSGDVNHHPVIDTYRYAAGPLRSVLSGVYVLDFEWLIRHFRTTGYVERGDVHPLSNSIPGMLIKSGCEAVNFVTVECDEQVLGVNNLEDLKLVRDSWYKRVYQTV